MSAKRPKQLMFLPLAVASLWMISEVSCPVFSLAAETNQARFDDDAIKLPSEVEKMTCKVVNREKRADYPKDSFLAECGGLSAVFSYFQGRKLSLVDQKSFSCFDGKFDLSTRITGIDESERNNKKNPFLKNTPYDSLANLVNCEDGLYFVRASDSILENQQIFDSNKEILDNSKLPAQVDTEFTVVISQCDNEKNFSISLSSNKGSISSSSLGFSGCKKLSDLINGKKFQANTVSQDYLEGGGLIEAKCDGIFLSIFSKQQKNTGTTSLTPHINICNSIRNMINHAKI